MTCPHRSLRRRDERQRPVRHQPLLGQPPEEVGQPGQVPVRQARSPGRPDTPGRPARSPRCAGAPPGRAPPDAPAPRRANPAGHDGLPAPTRAAHRAGRPTRRRRTAARSTPSTPRPDPPVPGSATGPPAAARRRRSPGPHRGATPRAPARSGASARAVAKWGRTPQRCRQSRSSSSTEVREDAVTRMVRRSSSASGRRENSATLCTGPSQLIARSGSRWYSAAFRAYSTAETTLTCSSPAASRSLSSEAVPVTRLAGTPTSPRSIAA